MLRKIDNKQFSDTILIYSLVTAISLSVFFLQVHFVDVSLWFIVLIYLLVFLALHKLFDYKAFIYSFLISLIFQVAHIIANPNINGSRNLTICILIVLSGIYYLLIQEVAKRKQLYTSASEKHFKSLVNYSLQPLIVKNKKGEIIFTSESIKELLGLKQNVKSGTLIDIFLHPDDVSRHKHFLKDIISNPFEKKSIELRMKKGDTNWIWVKNESINLLKQKDIKAIVSSIQDISFQKELDREKVDIIHEEKKARELAERALKERDEFISIASHELKTPLTTITLQLQSTLRRILTQSLADFSGSALLNSLQIAEKQSQRLATLISDLLNVSLASVGKFSLKKEKLDLVVLVQSLIQRFEQEIILSGCKVNFEIRNQNIIGNWDKVRIEQVITNIFINAIKYSNKSDINISVYQNEKWALVSIKDKGKGIDKKYQESIFEPFKRLKTDENSEGLGVGLFIAKQIALSHGGDVKVNSELGKGSEFILYLPLPFIN